MTTKRIASTEAFTESFPEVSAAVAHLLQEEGEELATYELTYFDFDDEGRLDAAFHPRGLLPIPSGPRASYHWVSVELPDGHGFRREDLGKEYEAPDGWSYSGISLVGEGAPPS